jgi:hypothetical protein
VLKDFVQFLSQPKEVRRMREILGGFQSAGSTVFLVGPKIELPEELSHKAVYFEIQLPTKVELQDVIKTTYQSLSKVKQIPVVLQQQDFDRLGEALRGLTLNQARQVMAYAMLENMSLDSGTIAKVLNKKASLIADDGLLEYYPAGTNNHALGGFARLKSWIQRAEAGFSAGAKELNLPAPKGVLLLGVPGCGKSLAAMVIAQEWSVPLLKLDAGRLFDRYIGESEKNFRRAIQTAESMAPCVLWIDEIEKAMSTTGGSDNDGGLSRRIFGSFLTWLQEKKEFVFVIATANEVDRLPPELLRKGRFDEIFFVDLPNSAERAEIFRIHIGRRNVNSDAFAIEPLAARSEGFSGAEIEQCIIAAAYRSLHEKKLFDTHLVLDEIASTHPLSHSRAQYISDLRDNYKSLFIDVSAPA